MKSSFFSSAAKIALLTTAAVLASGCGSKPEPQVLEKDPSYSVEDEVIVIADKQSGKLEEKVWKSPTSYILRSARPGSNTVMIGTFALKDQATLDAEKAAKDAEQTAQTGAQKGAAKAAKKHQPEKKIPVTVEDIRKERQLFHMQDNLDVMPYALQHTRLMDIYAAALKRTPVPDTASVICTKPTGDMTFHCRQR